MSSPGTIAFDNGVKNDRWVLLVKASKDELDNVRRYYLTYNNDGTKSERRTGKADIIEAPPGTNDPTLYTLIITIPFKPVQFNSSSYGGNTRKKNTRKSTRKSTRKTRKNKNT